MAVIPKMLEGKTRAQRDGSNNTITPEHLYYGLESHSIEKENIINPKMIAQEY